MTEPAVVQVEIAVPEELYQKVVEKVEKRGGFELLVNRFLTNLLTDDVAEHSADPALCEHPESFETPSGKRFCPWCKKDVTP